MPRSDQTLLSSSITTVVAAVEPRKPQSAAVKECAPAVGVERRDSVEVWVMLVMAKDPIWRAESRHRPARGIG
ncbi:hypothetical protein Maq22A_c04475 [Methylobacterium aquaticum]|uniref:Uncharacterized protein n=1 Tax=Methylobacterium aquaticum TaxID=270351 RepID=A0A0C6FGX6_9HYPH|nr:hypothetical protein Maq22A_c04475 [Methylobacterium aquaticum]